MTQMAKQQRSMQNFMQAMGMNRDTVEAGSSKGKVQGEVAWTCTALPRKMSWVD